MLITATPSVYKNTMGTSTIEKADGRHATVVHHAAYKSTALRTPKQPLIAVAQSAAELSGPRFDAGVLTPHSDDLTKQCAGEPLGERIVVTGRVLDAFGQPLAGTLVEIWQCNAAGRYKHEVDQHPAPLDPYFLGNGRVLTDAQGRYRFTTIKPGAYPWRNHHNAWRPAHIHFSVHGHSILQRLVTQMYFPGDPLLPLDPIFNSAPTSEAKERLIARFDIETTQPEWALGYQFDIVLRGEKATPTQP
jgi:protocatechuate 3,4-dioxygenase, beta subunit